MREIILPDSETAKTFEKFLSKQFPIGYVRKLLRRNGARINGRRAKENDLVRAGDRIQLFIPYEAKTKPAKTGPSDSRLATIFEDDSLLVINKPAGMAVHEGKTVSKSESLLGILENRYRATGVKPQLVHRLDRDTSGIVLVAKDEQIRRQLIEAFEASEVLKAYTCLVAGRLRTSEGKIDLPLPGREGHLVRALSQFKVVKRFAETTFTRVIIDTGRLHQIRLHFAKLGYPVVLDDQHGDFAFNKRFRKEYGLKRQFLHAEKLKIEYRGKAREWTAPLAEDLQRVLVKLERA